MSLTRFPRTRPVVPPAGQSISKLGPVSTNQTVAQTPSPATTTGASQIRLSAYTYFTKIPTNGQNPQILYNGDQMWARLTLELETAGPVAVGQSSDLFPVLSGKGLLLETGNPISLDVAKGNVIYVAASGVNRIKVKLEPYPWLETITGLISAIVGSARGAVTLVKK